MTVRPAKGWPGRADQDHLVLEDRLEAHGAVAPRSAHDPELELAVGDELDDRLRVVHLERDAEAGVALVELAEQHRHDDRGRPGRGADRELARELAAAVRGDLAEHLLFELQHPLGAAVEAQARLGRLDPPAGAVEQLHPEALLERAHLQRDSGLGDAQALGRLREAPPLDDGAKRRELTRVHKRMLISGSVLASNDVTQRGPLRDRHGRAHEGLDRHDELAARAVFPAADRAARGAGS